MRYLLSNTFTQISMTSGTIQNVSKICTIEMSSSNTANTGILIPPLQLHTFTGNSIYLRCVDGHAEARVVSFLLDVGGGSSGSSSGDSGEYVDDSEVITDEDLDDLLDDVFSDTPSASPQSDEEINEMLDDIFG